MTDETQAVETLQFSPVEFKRDDEAPNKEFMREYLMLMHQHWLEVFGPDNEFAPNAAAVYDLWQSEVIVFLAARDSRGVVRGLQQWAGEQRLMNGDLTAATLNAVYVEPGYRGQSMEFLRWGMATIRPHVTQLYWMLQADSKLDVIAKRLGGKPYEVKWSL